MSATDFKIIIIDDNPAIHQDFIKILSSEDATREDAFNKLSVKIFGKQNEVNILESFEITTASQGQEGVALIKKALEEGRPYSLAFVDIRMPPGWDGIETIKHIWELDKDIQVVICTAFSDYSWEETIEHLGKTDNLLVLKKPFDNVSVRQLACALTKKWQLLQETRQYTDTLQQQVEDRTLSLQKSLSLVKATLESSTDGIIVINNNGFIIDYNQRFLSMWNISEDFLAEKKGTIHYQTLFNQMKEFFQDPVPTLKIISSFAGLTNMQLIKLKDGKVYEFSSQPQILNSESVGNVLSFHDITERAKLEEKLHYQAHHDMLTGLPNRVMLLDQLRTSIQAAKQNDSKLAVIFLDLDRFKLINDSLSHVVGDELLEKASKRLLAIITPDDMLARLGGDEFVILLQSFTTIEELKQRAQQIIELFQKPFGIAEREVTITASVGISTYPENGKTSDVLLKNADSAMYSAKEHGSNNFKFYMEEMNNKNLEKLDYEMDLRQAIDKKEFFLVYQPQYELTGNKLVAVEALIRWQHPKKGILLPIDFVPLAEETGLIIPIGEWVLRTACKQNKSWQDAGFPPIRIAVNVTAQQLHQQNFMETVKNILFETKLSPQYLEIELTENVIISSLEIIETVRSLKQLGVIIAIDDFGTGYSSLSYLKKLPLDRLKIDSSFIQHIKSEHDDEAIIRAIISMANNLNLEVLAEGVETEHQLSFLKNNQCNEIQGFYFSKPLNHKDLEKLLKTQTKGEKVTT